MSRNGAPLLLVFDSGIGGLSVLHEIRLKMPAAPVLYVADDAAFPYGEKDAEPLRAHIMAVMERLVDAHRPDAIVVACHTASPLVLPPLRARYSVPIIGTVPAVKPAAERTESGLVSVLSTPGTMRRDYTRSLIESFARTCSVRLVGSVNLASQAEAMLRGEPVSDEAIFAEIAPAFVETDGRRTDTIVLACTHYPFLIDRFEALAPWPVTWINPAEAIARRVASVMGVAPGAASLAIVRGEALLTSGRDWPSTLLPLLDAFGLSPAAEAVR